MTTVINGGARQTVVTQQGVSKPVVLKEPGVGPAGPMGPAGAGASSYVHTQGAASATWTINHNQNRRLVAQVFTNGWVQISAEVVHPSLNQTIIQLTSPISGFAVLVPSV